MEIEMSDWIGSVIVLMLLLGISWLSYALPRIITKAIDKPAAAGTYLTLLWKPWPTYEDYRSSIQSPWLKVVVVCIELAFILVSFYVLYLFVFDRATLRNFPFPDGFFPDGFFTE